MPESYILNVGTVEERKNVLLLIKALSQLPKDLRSRFGHCWTTDKIQGQNFGGGTAIRRRGEDYLFAQCFVCRFTCDISRGASLCLSLHLRRIWNSHSRGVGVVSACYCCHWFMSKRSRRARLNLCQSFRRRQNWRNNLKRF